MSNLLSENWLFTTVAIEDDTDKAVGTGFLVGDTKPEENEYGGLRPTWRHCASRAYLVTARHVLGANASEIENTLHYAIVFGATGASGPETRRIRFDIKNSPANWTVHPDPAVDVAVLDLGQNFFPAEANLRFCPLSELANTVSLLDIHCDSGDDVFVLGYPLTLRQGRSNLPLVRKGVLASSPRFPLDEGGRSLRGFLVDGAIMPGSSGSPVISASARFHGGDLAMTPARPLLLGVAVQEWGRGAAARYEAAGTMPLSPAAMEGYANLGFVQSAAAVIETVTRLGHHTTRDFLQLDHDQHWAPQLGVAEWRSRGRSGHRSPSHVAAASRPNAQARSFNQARGVP